jgi:glycyl-radical enzyme activating protein
VVGVVLDIQRFALHDGPGIRTTVFLKGCPLSCVWCHNPESQAFSPELSYNSERCTECPACAEARQQGVMHLQSGPQALDLQDPLACATACPHGAFTVLGKHMDVEEVMSEVMRDAAYYHRSGGGITLSGGEPLAQFDFSLALLHAAREAGIHTCLDTSGATSLRRIAAVSEVVDLFLFDHKVTEVEEHRNLTGLSNLRILSNLDFLYQRGARIILRCPLIPGINDSEAHLAGIAALSKRYPRLQGIEIMAYHGMGRDKSERIGRSYLLMDVPDADEGKQGHWISELHALGCSAARIG